MKKLIISVLIFGFVTSLFRFFGVMIGFAARFYTDPTLVLLTELGQKNSMPYIRLYNLNLFFLSIPYVVFWYVIGVVLGVYLAVKYYQKR